MFLSHVFHPKVIYDQSECDRACGMFPKAGGICAFIVSMWEKSFCVVTCPPKYRPGGAPKWRSTSRGRQTHPVQVSLDCIVFQSNLGITLTEFSYTHIG
jgi:hypothetical protein